MPVSVAVTLNQGVKCCSTCSLDEPRMDRKTVNIKAAPVVSASPLGRAVLGAGSKEAVPGHPHRPCTGSSSSSGVLSSRCNQRPCSGSSSSSSSS